MNLFNSRRSLFSSHAKPTPPPHPSLPTLNLALYARGGYKTYHSALLLCPPPAATNPIVPSNFSSIPSINSTAPYASTFSGLPLALTENVSTEPWDGLSYRRYHAKNPLASTTWLYEVSDFTPGPGGMLLVRIQLASVTDVGRLEEVLGSVSVRQGLEGWNCVSWVREALEALEQNERVGGEGKRCLGGQSCLDMDVLAGLAQGYADDKKKGGRWSGVIADNRVPLWDAVAGKELIS